MKVKKLPIFLEITRKSFFVIVLILVIYAIAQLIIFGTFTNDYERDLLTNTYQSLSNLSENVNNDISQKRFYEYLEFILMMEYILKLSQMYGNILNLTMNMIRIK